MGQRIRYSIVLFLISNASYSMQRQLSMYAYKGYEVHDVALQSLLNIDKECCICFEQKELQNILCRSQQGHSEKICDHCLNDWRERGGQCPLCRSLLYDNYFNYCVDYLVRTYCKVFLCG